MHQACHERTDISLCAMWTEVQPFNQLLPRKMRNMVLMDMRSNLSRMH